MQTAVIYVRVSTEEQVSRGTGLEIQRRECLEFAERRGVRVIATCEDAGCSGARYETRHGLQRALSIIEEGQAELLIVHKLDRLGRSTRIALQITERVDRAGGRIITVDGQEYGQTPSGKMLLTVLSGVAEMERGMIRDRTMAGRRERARQGQQPQRGQQPFGYHVTTRSEVQSGLYPESMLGKYIILEDKARWIRFIFEQYATGQSCREIARQLTASGVKLSSGKDGRWRGSTISSMLRRPIYRGCAVYNRMETKHDERRVTEMDKRSVTYFTRRPEEEWITFDAPAIIDADLWQRCQERASENKATQSGPRSRRYLLSSLVHCPRCGKRMFGQRKKDRRFPWYQCHHDHCGRAVMIDAPVLETAVKDILRFAATGDFREKTLLEFDAYENNMSGEDSQSNIKSREDALKELEARAQATARAQVNALLAGGRESDFAPIFREIDEQRTAIEKELIVLRGRRAAGAAGGSDLLSHTEKLQQAISAIETVLSASEDEFPTAQKQAMLTGIIRRITPDGDSVFTYFETGTVFLICVKASVTERGAADFSVRILPASSLV